MDKGFKTPRAMLVDSRILSSVSLLNLASCFFKYYDFFTENLETLLVNMEVSPGDLWLSIVFQSVSRSIRFRRVCTRLTSIVALCDRHVTVSTSLCPSPRSLSSLQARLKVQNIFYRRSSDREL